MKPTAPLRDGVGVALAGFALRAGVSLWAAGRFPPSEDGRFYHVLASRMAAGEGYSWLWPDGVVTPVAHYPVGYAALLAAVYSVFGVAPWLAMAVNSIIGGVGVLAAHRIAARGASRLGALLGAGLVAAHPALVFYTPAVMTEGIAASVLAVIAWSCLRMARARRPLVWALAVGVLFGAFVLMRPQMLLLAPVFAVFGAPSMKAALLRAALVTTMAVACVLPWTYRNCTSMDRCAFVSANGGWNLWIGAPPHATGTFLSVAGDTVPEQCRSVFPEVAKDVCFARAARHNIARAPGAWIRLIPKKLAHTFDYCGAAGWYLHAANPAAFDSSAKLTLGVVETTYQRVLLMLGLLSFAGPGPRRRLRRLLVGAGSLALLTPLGWLGYLTLGIVAPIARRPRPLLSSSPAYFAWAAVAMTALTHAVFFGAGRYGMVTFVVLGALSGSLLTAKAEPGDTASQENSTDALD